MNTLIVITGPTGVGKTELCLSIAEHYGIDIINADSRQIFAELPIGTAAPTLQQQQRVHHHFVATHHIGDYYSASMYEQDVLRLIEEQTQESSMAQESSKVQADIEPDKLFLLTGGSMMYIDAVCNGIDDIPTVDYKTREWMKQRLHDEGLDALTEELKQLDPEHWEIVDKKNPRRVVHALEICHMTGKTYTSFRSGKKKERPFNVIKIGLTRDTIDKVKRGVTIYNHNALYERINARVLQMMDEGLLEEARAVLPYRGHNALNTVGYKELFRYFDGDIPLEEAVRQIQSNSREYARKQLTWFKKDPQVTWFHPDDIDAIIKHIDARVDDIDSIVKHIDNNHLN